MKSRATVGTSTVNVFALAQDINWGKVFDTAYELDVSSSSTADATTTGAKTIVIYGLDKSYVPLAETVTMNGQTVVTTASKFLRVFAAYVVTTGSGSANAGDIYIVKTGTGGMYTTGVPGTLTSGCIKMIAGDNLGYSGVFTAPKGTIYAMESFIPSSRAQAGTITFIKASPTETTGAGPFSILKYEVSAGASLESVHPCFVLNEKEDIYTKAVCAGAGGIVNITIHLNQVV